MAMSKGEMMRNAVKKRIVKHIGFKGAEEKVEGEGYSAPIAARIIASASRNASKAAKKANPRLARVKG
jgi:hypothetical protein